MKLKPLLLAASLLVAAPAAAQDYCITFPGFNDVLVGHPFTIPKRGQCVRWVGFTPTLGGEGDANSTGTACTSADGRHLKLLIISGSGMGSIIVNDMMDLALPAGDGFDQQYDTQILNTPFWHGTGVQGNVCQPQTVPNMVRDATAAPNWAGVKE